MAKPMSKERAAMFPPTGKRAKTNVECLLCGRVLAGRVGYITHHDYYHTAALPSWRYTTKKVNNPKLLPSDARPQYHYHCHLCDYTGTGKTALYKHFARHHDTFWPRRRYFHRTLRDPGTLKPEMLNLEKDFDR